MFTDFAPMTCDRRDALTDAYGRRQVKQRFVEANYTGGTCSIQGQPDSTWVAVDAGSVVIHLFDQVAAHTLPRPTLPHQLDILQYIWGQC